MDSTKIKIVNRFIYCFGVIFFLFFDTETKGQDKAQMDAAIKQAKSTATGASGAFNAYRKFVDNDSVHWLYGGDASLSFSAISLTNWATGGEDQIGVRATVNLFANYKKGKRTFENYALLSYGVLKTGLRKAVKNDDRLHYTSKLGHSISPKLAYTTAFLARTQFASGYQYSGDEITAKVSDFLAPIYLYLSMGIDYKPNQNVSFMLSPVMGRATYVLSDSSTVVASAGMMTTRIDESGNKIQVPLKERYEFGGGLLFTLNGNLFKDRVTYSSQLDLFSNYIKDPQNMAVLWLFNTKILLHKRISANMQLELKYDDNQKTIDKETGELKGAKTQLKNYVGIGLFYQL